MKCPKCGALLEKGYIHAPRGIVWDIEKHYWTVLFSGEVLLSPFALTMPKKQAFRCPKCKLVLFAY